MQTGFQNLAVNTRKDILEKINIAEKMSLFDDHWVPRIVGELNGQFVKVVKLKGAYDRHHHAGEDEMFLVVKGRFRLELPGRTVELEEGEFFIVPRGIEHRPVAEEEVQVLLFEPASTDSLLRVARTAC